ncbi:MAG: AI-2E family transporter, partial [Chloroflexota bacterium]
MTTRPSLHPEGPEDQADGRAGADAPLVTQVVSQGEQLLSSRTGRIVARWLLVIVALVGVGWLFWRARQAMTPFMFGLVLAYLLTPLVNRLARYMRRPLAILIVYMIGIALLVLAFMYLIPPVFDQIQRLISNIPTVDELQELSAWFLERYRAIIPESLREPIDAGVIGALRSLQDNISAYVQQAGGWLATSLLRVVNTVTFLLGFLIVPIWLFYVINDQQQGMAFLNRIIHPRARSDFWNVVRVVDKVFTGYIRGQLILGVAVGLMAGAGLLLLQLFGFQTRYILLLAIIAGVTELIPIIGPILGAIPAVAIAFFSPEDPLRNGLAVLVLYIVIQ